MVVGIITSYWTVVFVHVLAVVVGFGLLLSCPLIWSAARRNDPRALPGLLRGMDRLGRAVIAPALFVILLSGVYLVAEGPYEFSASFVQVAFPILIVLIPLEPLYFGRGRARLAEIAARDIGAGGSGEVVLSRQFNALFRQVTLMAWAANAALAVAVFFMVVKP